MMERGATYPGEAPELPKKPSEGEGGWTHLRGVSWGIRKIAGMSFLSLKRQKGGIKGISRIELETCLQVLRFKESWVHPHIPVHNELGCITCAPSGNWLSSRISPWLLSMLPAWGDCQSLPEALPLWALWESSVLHFNVGAGSPGAGLWNALKWPLEILSCWVPLCPFACSNQHRCPKPT